MCSKQLEATEVRKEQTGYYLLVVHKCVRSVSLRFLRSMCFINPASIEISLSPFFRKQKLPKLLIWCNFPGTFLCFLLGITIKISVLTTFQVLQENLKM